MSVQAAAPRLEQAPLDPARLFAGDFSAERYAGYLGRLAVVYDALEEIREELAGALVVTAVHDPVLERTEALAADLAFWGGAQATQSAAATAYAARVRARASSPGRYVAHHCVRYLGDLSGSAAMRRLLRGRGDAFHRFAIADPQRYRDDYLGRLDSLALSAPEQARIAQETRAALQLQDALLTELAVDTDGHRR